jgi:NAD+ kinase
LKGTLKKMAEQKPLTKISFCASETDNAQVALKRLSERFGQISPSEAEVLVALGGDGFMLETLHSDWARKLPVYGMNRGTVGFLLNNYTESKLLERLERAVPVILYPLKMTAITCDGKTHVAHAINEVSLLRSTRQTAKIAIEVDGVERLDNLTCDGVLLATPAGSTAYNLSAHGPILPLKAQLLALTPISVFRPRRWRGALLPEQAKVKFLIKEAEKRPVSAVADSFEVRDVKQVEIETDFNRSFTLLFDPEQQLEERILVEQFNY